MGISLYTLKGAPLGKPWVMAAGTLGLPLEGFPQKIYLCPGLNDGVVGVMLQANGVAKLLPRGH